MENRRVVITGMGAVTPLGNDIESTWSAMIEGKSGIGKITQFDAAEFSCKIAGELKGFDPLNYVDKKDMRKMGRFIQLGMAASQMAFDDSGLRVTAANAARIGVSVGSGMGDMAGIEQWHSVFLKSGPKRITPFFVPLVIINLVSGNIAIRFGAKGPNTGTVTACATATHCIGDSYHIIKRGDADVMITGGTESVICPMAVGGFAAMKALSRRNDSPSTASRPFSVDRDGFVMGEGAGVLMLESLDSALDRGAKIYAEIAGYGMSGDAYHITAPSEDGDGAARCMKMAIKNAGINAGDIGYVNAHATSTAADTIETRAIKSVFGDKVSSVYISSTKSMTGHLLGAAGAVEAIFSTLAMERNILPPTINLHDADPECNLDYIPNKAREAVVDVVMSNSFGFGGTNATLVMKRYAGT